jgi:general secretion pathway protein D
VEVGLKLEVEPTIYMDDEVAIKVALEVSNIVNQIQTTSGTIAYQIGTRTANSVLRLKDGENQVLAGLINDNDRKAADKVPGLGDIPILGRLFGNQADNRLKTEIVLSITPRIIRNIPRPTLEQAEFDSGTEASLKSRGLEGSTGPAFTPPVPVTPAAPPLPAGPGAAPTPPTPPAVPDAAQTPPLTPGAVSTSAATAAVGDSGVARPGSGQPTASDSATAPVATPVGVAAAPAGAITAAGTRFAWNGPQQAPVGSTFTIELTVQPDQPITSIPFAIGFDPKLVEITAVTEGDFMRQGGAASTFTSRVDAAAGRVFATDTRNSADGATLSGTLVTLTIRTLSATPRASIQLVANSPIGVDGRSVTAQPTPEYVLQIIR